MTGCEFTPEQIAEIESARKTATNRKAAGDLEITQPLCPWDASETNQAENRGLCRGHI